MFCFPKKNGQVRLEIFLSVIVMIFVVGLIIMTFVITTSQLSSTDASYSRSGIRSVVGESDYMQYSGIGLIVLNASNNERGAICSNVVVSINH